MYRCGRPEAPNTSGHVIVQYDTGHFMFLGERRAPPSSSRLGDAALWDGDPRTTKLDKLDDALLLVLLGLTRVLPWLEARLSLEDNLLATALADHGITATTNLVGNLTCREPFFRQPH